MMMIVAYELPHRNMINKPYPPRYHQPQSCRWPTPHGLMQHWQHYSHKPETYCPLPNAPGAGGSPCDHAGGSARNLPAKLEASYSRRGDQTNPRTTEKNREDNTKCAAFKVGAVQCTDICIFAYMASANLFVQLIHSITSYHDHSGASPDLNAKAIRFMGDRVGPTAPMHVVIPPSLGWTPQEVGGVSDHLAWVLFYADASNRTQFYVPEAEVATTTIKIPSLLHLPHILADVILAQPQTCINVFSKVSCLVRWSSPKVINLFFVPE